MLCRLPFPDAVDGRSPASVPLPILLQVVCMSIDRTTFTALLGPLQTILSRRSIYQQIAHHASLPPLRAKVFAQTLSRGDHVSACGGVWRCVTVCDRV